MILLNDSLVDLVKREVVSVDEAYAKSVDKGSLVTLLKSAGLALPGVPGLQPS
jgi:hypothetical protein